MSLNSASRGAALLLGGATGWSASSSLLMANSLNSDNSSDFTDEDAPIRNTKRITSAAKDTFGFSKKLTLSSVNGPISPNSSLSRFKRDFVKLSDLGRGGYGRVFKARNVLDGQQYAVKKIKLGSSPAVLEAAAELMCSVPTIDVSVSISHENSYQEAKHPSCDVLGHKKIDVLREARVMAELCRHKHLVRYYQSWLDIERTDSDESELEYSSSEDEFSDDSDSESEHDTSRASPFQLCLYIQMQLCSAQTLRDWLDEARKDSSFSFAVLSDDEIRLRLDLARQILAGLAHIHGRGYVHFDITPANIFLKKKGNGEYHVKLGDFGLTASKRDAAARPSSEQGTLLYMSPERIETNKSVRLDEKVDIYAAGAILLELFCGFSTEMERIQSLLQLRSGKIPTELSKRLQRRSDIIDLIRSMTSTRPSQRPSATTLLQGPVFTYSDDSTNSTTVLISQLREKEEQLRKQQETIEKLQREVQRLQGGQGLCTS